MVTHFWLSLGNVLGISNASESFNSASKPYEILEVANAQQGKKQILYWHLATGNLIKARVVKVLNAKYILVKERRLFGSLATLIDLKEVVSVSSRISVS
jgi:hypothetical protein